MRDIRGDLQERANLLEQQMSAVQGQLNRQIDQLKREHETRLKDLKSALDTVHTVIGIEGRRLCTSPSVTRHSLRQVTPDPAGASPTTTH
jgi:hypothetical protein